MRDLVNKLYVYDLQSLLLAKTTNQPLLIGGGARIRTADLLRARQTLYQLSYTPCFYTTGGPKSIRTTDLPVISGVL